MRPQYVAIPAGQAKIVPLDTNKNSFNVSVQAPGCTVEHSLDQLQNPLIAPVWAASPDAVNGIINYQFGITGLRITSTGLAQQAVVLQNGIQ